MGWFIYILSKRMKGKKKGERRERERERERDKDIDVPGFDVWMPGFCFCFIFPNFQLSYLSPPLVPLPFQHLLAGTCK
jgi:hypothetical protein